MEKNCRCAQTASQEATSTCVHSSAEPPEVTSLIYQRKCSTFEHLNLEISAATVFLLMWFSVDLTSNSQESGCMWSELVLYLDCSWCADCILSRKSQKIEDSMFKIFFVYRLIDEHCHVSFTLKGLGSPLTKIQRIFGHNRVNKGEGNSVLYANMLPPRLCSPQGLFALS